MTTVTSGTNARTPSSHRVLSYDAEAARELGGPS
jgi:hypothetical protein